MPGRKPTFFAWGLIVAFAAKGEPPFGAGPADAILYRILHGSPDTAAVPRELRALVDASLARKPDERPTARDLMTRLTSEAAQEGGPDEIPTQLVLSSTWRFPAGNELKPTRRRRWNQPAVIISSAALAAAIAGAVVALPRGPVANVVAAAVLFILALMVLHVIAKLAAGRVKHSALSPIDRTLGLLFGLARGLLLVCVGYIVLAWFWPPNGHRPRWFATAHSLPYLQVGADQIESFFSRSTRTNPGLQGSSMVEKEAEQAISAFRNPTPAPAAPAADPPTYTSGEQRDLNRLIQQKNTP